MRNSVCASWFFCFSSVNGLHCIGLLAMATLKFAVFCCNATLMWRQRTASNCRPLFIIIIAFMKRNFAHVSASWFFCFSSVNTLHCIYLLPLATLKFAVFCCSATLMWRQRKACIAPPYFYCFYEAKLCLRKLILLLFFSQQTPLHRSAFCGHLEVCRLLLQCNADVDAKDDR